MSESELIDMTDEEQYVEIICVRGTVLRAGEILSPGDVFTVPVKNQQDGIPPLRWWIYKKKAARNQEEFDAFTGAVYNGRKGGPSAPIEPPKPPKPPKE